MKKTSIALAAVFALGTVGSAMAAELDVEPAPAGCHDAVHADGADHILALPFLLVHEAACILHLDHLDH